MPRCDRKCDNKAEKLSSNDVHVFRAECSDVGAERQEIASKRCSEPGKGEVSGPAKWTTRREQADTHVAKAKEKPAKKQPALAPEV